MDIRLTEYDVTFLDASYKWLTDPEIKELTMTPDIDKNEQKKWFEGLKHRDDYLVKGITADGVPVGAVGLKHIDFTKKTAEYFGYIGEKEYWGKGIGNKMMQYIEKEAKSMNLLRLYLNVLKINYTAINLYQKNGYKVQQYCGKLIMMDKLL